MAGGWKARRDGLFGADAAAKIEPVADVSKGKSGDRADLHEWVGRSSSHAPLSGTGVGRTGGLYLLVCKGDRLSCAGAGDACGAPSVTRQRDRG